MTRRSKREIEQALEELGSDVNTVPRWVKAYLNSAFTGKVGIEFASAADHQGEICILTADNYEIYTPLEEIPSWISVDDDLPIETSR